MKLTTPVPVLGIVGGIGSGKSYVSSLFAKLGAVVIDADRIGHEALVQPAIIEKIRDYWGEVVLTTDQQIDRKKLGAIVFANAHEKTRLEALVHPYIHQAILKQIEQAARNTGIRLVILDAAIMLETGWKDACEAVIFVEASESVRLQRVAARGWDAAELKKREASQWPLEKKKALCQHIIPNEGDEVFTKTLVNDLFTRYARR